MTTCLLFVEICCIQRAYKNLFNCCRVHNYFSIGYWRIVPLHLKLYLIICWILSKMKFKQFLTNSWRLVNSNGSLINRSTNSVLDCSNAGYAHKTVEEKLGLPPRPKKPSPPFFQFLHEKRPDMMKNKNMNLMDAVRKVSELWKNIDIDIKNKMIENYNKEQEQYKEIIEAYNQGLTREQKNELSRAKYKKTQLKTKRKIKKEQKELGKPHKPRSAYLIFVTERMKDRGNTPVQIFMKTVAKDWQELDTSSKEKYNAIALEENNNYVSALKEWENSMLKIGRFDLVRINVTSSVENNNIKNVSQD
ncbi:transcription factor A, mitochondrial [Adelges cooleyi]|uniref:transcription factor A, mitochondrial n=1 Tax=Adelges cooleyi TaxID=133065 RepID=UPI00217FD9CF|nr:transcription factor A, mitochondrial [Adelges cooleyi]